MAEESKEEYSYKNKLLTPKYIVGYLVFAAVAYGLIYYFVFYNKGASYTPPGNNTYNQPAQPAAPAPAVTPTTQAASMTVTMNAQNSSGENGTATLSDMNGKTKVVLGITGEASGASQPAHIHVGACPNVGAVKYPLTNVVDGKSETVVDVSLDQLKSMLPLAINVHKSAAAIQTYVSCGDLK